MQTCRVCGCTDENACAGGCAWFEPDLCSLCALAAAAVAEWAIRCVSPNNDALLAEAHRMLHDPERPLIIVP